MEQRTVYFTGLPTVCVILLLALGLEAGERRSCPVAPGFTYIPSSNPCAFFVCLSGQMIQRGPSPCPRDARFYARMRESQVPNPCERCPYASVPDEVTTPTSVTDLTKRITQMLPGYNLFGAIWAGQNYTITSCLALCQGNPECFGFDFDSSDSSCWLHDDTSICQEPSEKDGCTHIKLFDGCDEKPGLCPPVPSGGDVTCVPGCARDAECHRERKCCYNGCARQCLEPVPHSGGFDTDQPINAFYPGRHLPSGERIEMPGVMTTPTECISLCHHDNNCVGIDFDGRSATCWLHTARTECQPMAYKSWCDHYRVKDVCDEEATTLAPLTTPPSETPGDIQTTNVPPGTVPHGFVEVIEDVHVPGGMRVFVSVTLQQCLDACAMTSHCLAVDYNAFDFSCYFHYQPSYCGRQMAQQGTLHAKRVPCVRGIANEAREVRFLHHVAGGVPFCQGCPIGFCLENCYGDPACAGVDYDIRNRGCYHFTREAVCGVPIPKEQCIHVSIYSCVSEDNLSTPQDSLLNIRYPPPSHLFTGWQAYPGARLVGGIQVPNPDHDPDYCVALCHQDPDCQAGEYDTADGSCWVHTDPEQKCRTLEASERVFHFKKPEPCAFVEGSDVPYMSASWVSQ